MNLNFYTPTLLAHLATYPPYDEAEAVHLTKTLHFLQTHEEPFTRATLVGHITASAVLVDANFTAVALIFHAKLGRWFQPGGHCEVELDASVSAAALRELAEETEVPAPQLHLLQETPFDIDVHEIPARGDEPTHWHYDIRYLFQTAQANLPENEGCQWKPIQEVALNPDPSRSRFAAKLLAWVPR